MSSSQGRPVEPPSPPDVGRSLHIGVRQWLGIGLLAAVPVIALSGILGDSEGSAQAAAGSFELRVRYPKTGRFQAFRPLHVWVRNTSAATLDTVIVAFDTSYISRFAQVAFNPGATDGLQVPLTGLAPGETRQITVELRGHRYWQHRGRIVATAAQDSAVARVATFVFP